MMQQHRHTSTGRLWGVGVLLRASVSLAVLCAHNIWFSTLNASGLFCILSKSSAHAFPSRSCSWQPFALANSRQLIPPFLSMSTSLQATAVPVQLLSQQPAVITVTPMSLIPSVQELLSVSKEWTLQELSDSIQQWTDSLGDGVLPENPRFPSQVLFDMFSKVAIDLSLPSFASRHRVLIPALIQVLLEMSIELSNQLNKKAHAQQFDKDQLEHSTIQNVDEEAIIQAPLNKFVATWQPLLNGVACLDTLYGKDYHLLCGSDQFFTKSTSMTELKGFGLYDGIWKHSGWHVMNDVQNELRKMTELRRLIRAIGKRSSIDGKSKRKTVPRIQHLQGSIGVHSSSLHPAELTGLRQSNTLDGLLVSEALLLVNSSVAPSLQKQKRKLLFLSKLAEGRLWSYEYLGWIDERSKPKRNPRNRYHLLPVKPGGPIVVCLDSSFSMAGPREMLAKAVVLECATMANALDRECFVMSFSGSSNLQELSLCLGSMKTRQGLQHLLDFLGNSYYGGTDVVTPLRRALDLVDQHDRWSGADVLLVTDGELQYPPMDEVSLSRLRQYESTKGLEVHGLLIGCTSSRALEELCTSHDGIDRVHDFLTNLDPLLLLQRQMKNKEQDQLQSTLKSSAQTLQMKPSICCKSRYSNPLKLMKKGHRIKSRWALQCHLADFAEEPPILHDSSTIGSLKNIAHASLLVAENLVAEHRRTLSPIELNLDITQIGKNHIAIQGLLMELNSGLVERESEVKLLVLAAISHEHLLLIGPPGTAKSELGRRLSRCFRTQDQQNASSIYFERLLTKYTTIDEVFGPLSLAALERDLYVRKTDGYLPSAHVAFIDEIFKSNSAILNAMLTVLNERKYDNGNSRIEIPLMTVVGASNELPDSDELDALYDRFLFRKAVHPVSDKNIDQLLQQSPHAFTLPSTYAMDSASIKQIREDSLKVKLPKYVIDGLKSIRSYLSETMDPPVYVSDRRLMKAVNILKIVAYTQGRSSIEPVDFLVLKHVLWHQQDQIDELEALLWRNIVPEVENINAIEFIVEKFLARINKLNDRSALQIGSDLLHCRNIVVDKIAILDHLRDLYLSKDYSWHWLSTQDLMRIKQNAVHEINLQRKPLIKLLLVICAVNDLLFSDVSDGNYGNESEMVDDSGWANKLDIAQQIWKVYKNGIDLSTIDDNDALAHSADIDSDDSLLQFSAADLKLSKKEAQRKFTKETFKIWKKALKSAKQSDYEVDDD